MNDPKLIDPDNREEIPDALKKSGFEVQQLPYQYYNEITFKSITDHIWGTSAQVAVNNATFYTDASGNPLDKSAASVTINEDDKILIVHDVAATVNMALKCGGKTVTLEMIDGVTMAMSTFTLTIGETGDQFKGDIRLTGTNTLTIEESSGFRVTHDSMAISNLAGDITINNVIDGDSTDIINLDHGSEVDNPSSGVHGVVGSVVGTTDTQTLTNKTISDLVNGATAWVSFSFIGAVLTIYDSYGMTVTRTGIGRGTATFDTNMDDTNYAVFPSSFKDSGDTGQRLLCPFEDTITVSGFDFDIRITTAAAGAEEHRGSLVIFGGRT